jgi:DNA primase
MEAIPVMDYAFNRITAGLDLNTARDKSLIVDKLLPLISQIKNLVRQSHYLQKLARLVEISFKKLEMIMESSKPKRRFSQSKINNNTRSILINQQELLSNPIENDCLAFLLQHPELKALSRDIMPEFFWNSENREIFNAYKSIESISSIKKNLDDSIWEYFDKLKTKEIPTDRLEERLSDCILRLRNDYWLRLARKREAILASEAESGGSAAELYNLGDQDLEISSQLRDIHIHRSRVSQKQRKNI